MTQRIELFYDFRSPYSYLAFYPVARDGCRHRASADEGPQAHGKGRQCADARLCRQGRDAHIDLARWGQRYGIMFNPSNMRDNDGHACSRAVLAAGTPGASDAITLALYRVMWSEGKTLATTDDILAVIAQLDANTDEAAERGVFGSPTILVGDAMFFGNDRLDFVREELARLEEAA
jgi:2-hydroxychromene-2-carboxylate isomerase